MLRVIRENTPETGVKLVGIHFGDPIKRNAMSTLQQWEGVKTLIESNPVIPNATTRPRYPTKLEMEIPTKVAFIAFPGK